MSFQLILKLRPLIRLPTAHEDMARRMALLIVVLTSPLFVLRWRDSSFSLIDLLLCMLGGYSLWLLCGDKQLRSTVFSRIRTMLLAGLLFSIAALISAFSNKWIPGSKFVVERFLSGLSQYGFLMLWVPLVLGTFLRRQDLGFFVKAICIANLFPVLVSIIGFFPIFPDKWYYYSIFSGRATGTFENPNALATVLVVLCPSLMALAVSSKTKTWRKFGFFVFPLYGLSLFLTFSFGLFLAFVLTALFNLVWIFLWKAHPNRRYPWRTFFLIVCTMLFASIAGQYMLRLQQSWRLRERLATVKEVVKNERSPINLGSGLARLGVMEEGGKSLSQRNIGWLG